MSRCYVDTNFIYAHLRATPGSEPAALLAWREKVLANVNAGGGVIGPLVLDELAYRLILAWLRDDGDADPLSTYRSDPRAVMHRARRRLSRVWRVVDDLALELHPTDRDVVGRARELMIKPGLPPRDSFHAAHALAAGCDVIASADRGLQNVPGLRLLHP